MYDDIKILKPGEIGFGVMIEQDAGYISPNDIRNKPFINEIQKLSEGKNIMVEPLVLYVVLQKYGVENRNGRIYPEHILKREVNNYQELIQQHRAIGEAEHPESSIINTDRVSHNIIETWWEGKTLLGKMEIIMSPGFINQGIISCKGDQIANLLRKNIMIGVSSRGVGSLQEIDDKAIVQDDFELICWDIVTSPSTPGSWVLNKREDMARFTENKKHKKSVLIEKLDEFLL